jgi:hypothetical protein
MSIPCSHSPHLFSGTSGQRFVKEGGKLPFVPQAWRSDPYEKYFLGGRNYTWSMSRKMRQYTFCNPASTVHWEVNFFQRWSRSTVGEKILGLLDTASYSTNK